MPRTSWSLGRVAGIDLYLHPTFLFVPLLALWQGQGLAGVAMVILIFGCVLLHELGHALMARRYGIGTVDITLYPIGGVARLERMPRSAGPELLIALAGPAVNLAIAATLWAVVAAFGPWMTEDLAASLGLLTFVNVGLLIFNMLPVFPMDGGRVLRALLSGWLGRGRATEIAAGLGRGIALVAGSVFLLNALFVSSSYWMQVLLAGFVYMAASFELNASRREEALARGDSAWPAPPAGFRWVDRGDGVWRLAPIVVTNFGTGRTWR